MTLKEFEKEYLNGLNSIIREYAAFNAHKIIGAVLPDGSKVLSVTDIIASVNETSKFRATVMTDKGKKTVRIYGHMTEII